MKSPQNHFLFLSLSDESIIMPFTNESSLSWLYLSILSLHYPLVILILTYVLIPIKMTLSYYI